MYKMCLMMFLMMFLMMPISAFANHYLIGKWQCHVKHDDLLIKQESLLQFLKNGTMIEQVAIYYGQKDDYAYQIESATAKSKWKIQNDVLLYDDHQFYAYSVRMPNANKHDLQQANIAVQKSLPMVQDMMSGHINQRQFDLSFINKKTLIMNDADNQRFMTCHKKGWF